MPWGGQVAAAPPDSSCDPHFIRQFRVMPSGFGKFRRDQGALRNVSSVSELPRFELPDPENRRPPVKLSLVYTEAWLE